MADIWGDGIAVMSRASARRTGPQLGATRLLTLLDPDLAPAAIGLDPDRQLNLVVVDTHDRNAAHAADAGTVARMLAFAGSLPAGGKLLIHCLSGQSRSPAAALGILAQRAAPEAAVEALLRICPGATPNRLIVALCDEALGLGGKLGKAAARLPQPRWHRIV